MSVRVSLSVYSVRACKCEGEVSVSVYECENSCDGLKGTEPLPEK